ncbi:MAG: PorT family protein [Muribaculaceae bacterium]|nr:PorT family protein [Muribaculaceae bacterium]
MKTIKILAAGIVMTGSSLSLQAQHFTLGPEVGYERAAIHIGDTQNKGLSTHTGNGIKIGASAAYDFDNGLFLRSGLYYSHRGGAHLYGLNDTQRFPQVKDIFLKTTDFLTLPLTVGYELPFSTKWGVGVEAGGYIASGLGMGNSFFDLTNNEGSAGSVFKDSQFTVATPDGSDRTRVTIKGSDRIDAGCVFGAHIRFDRIKLRATYQLGLCKTIYDLAMPRTFTLSLAYDFQL